MQQRWVSIFEGDVKKRPHISAADLQSSFAIDRAKQTEQLERWRKLNGIICEVEVPGTPDGHLITRFKPVVDRVDVLNSLLVMRII